MATKTKKAAKRKTKKPMFRAETAGERRKNGGGCCGGETKGTYTLTFEPPKAGEVGCDTLQAAPKPKLDLRVAGTRSKRWSVQVRNELDGVVALVAVDDGSRASIANLLRINASGIYRPEGVDVALERSGYEMQGLPVDHLGRVKVEN
jgi:hypothetical protein